MGMCQAQRVACVLRCCPAMVKPTPLRCITAMPTDPQSHRVAARLTEGSRREVQVGAGQQLQRPGSEAQAQSLSDSKRRGMAEQPQRAHLNSNFAVTTLVRTRPFPILPPAQGPCRPIRPRGSGKRVLCVAAQHHKCGPNEAGGQASRGEGAWRAKGLQCQIGSGAGEGRLRTLCNRLWSQRGLYRTPAHARTPVHPSIPIVPHTRSRLQ